MNNIVGTRIGIYDVLYECDFKSNDGHRMYHVRCSECGWESDMHKNDVGRAKKCTHIGKLTQEQIDIWYEKNKKKCLQCGKYIILGNLGFEEYKERTFCSKSCSASYNNRITKKKGRQQFCVNCGMEVKYPNKYCSIECQVEFRFDAYINRWKNGEVDGMYGKYAVSKYIRKYLMNKYDNKCSRCGWGEINPFTKKIPLEVHHKDGDYTNNDESNLELLCPNCHSLTSTYRAGNYGHGRKERQKYS